MDKVRNKSVDNLMSVIAKMSSAEDCYAFFSDLCTIKELQDMAQRLETATLLQKGLNYQTISKQVGVSTTTISRVSRCLNYGAGGYGKALEKLKEDEAQNEA